jgi:hypothetical protein
MVCRNTGIGRFGRKLCVPMTDTSFGVVRNMAFCLLLIVLMVYTHLGNLYIHRRRSHRQSLSTEDHGPTGTQGRRTAGCGGVFHRIPGACSCGKCECPDCWEVSRLSYFGETLTHLYPDSSRALLLALDSASFLPSYLKFRLPEFEAL